MQRGPWELQRADSNHEGLRRCPCHRSRGRPLHSAPPAVTYAGAHPPAGHKGGQVLQVRRSLWRSGRLPSCLHDCAQSFRSLLARERPARRQLGVRDSVVRGPARAGLLQPAPGCCAGESLHVGARCAHRECCSEDACWDCFEFLVSDLDGPRHTHAHDFRRAAPPRVAARHGADRFPDAACTGLLERAHGANLLGDLVNCTADARADAGADRPTCATWLFAACPRRGWLLSSCPSASWRSLLPSWPSEAQGS